MKKNKPSPPFADEVHQSKGSTSVLYRIWNMFNSNIIWFCTVVLAITGIRQALIAQDTEERQLRAYVYVSYDTTLPPTGIVAVFDVANAGQTPAYDLAGTINYSIRKTTDSNINLAFSAIGRSTEGVGYASLYHGQVFAKEIGSMPEMKSEQLADFNSGKLIIYYYGQIKYRDAFGSMHFTNFCYNTLPSRGRAVALCRSGNESD